MMRVRPEHEAGVRLENSTLRSDEPLTCMECAALLHRSQRTNGKSSVMKEVLTNH